MPNNIHCSNKKKLAVTIQLFVANNTKFHIVHDKQYLF